MCDCGVCQDIDKKARWTADHIEKVLQDPKHEEKSAYERLVYALKDLWAMDALDFESSMDREWVQHKNAIMKEQLDFLGEQLTDKISSLLLAIPPFGNPEAWSLTSSEAPGLSTGQVALRPWKLTSKILDKSWGAVYALVGRNDDEEALHFARKYNKSLIELQQSYRFKLSDSFWVQTQELTRYREKISNFPFLIDLLSACLRNSFHGATADTLEAALELIK